MSEVPLGQLRSSLSALGRRHTPMDVAGALRDLGVVVTDALVSEAIEELRVGSVGAGRLEGLLALPGVSDVLVNGPDEVFVDRGAGLERVEVRFADDEEVRQLAARLAASSGRRLDDASPFVDGRLPGGVRLHAVLAPVAAPGTCLSLRIPARHNFSLDDLVNAGSLPATAADLLRGIVGARVPFLISGGTGSGKTTLLAALLAEVPPAERLVLVEDSRELLPNHPHCVRLEARQPNGEGVGGIDLTALVRQALRMRPDRIVLGEVRGAELRDLLLALNTGHEGGCGTVHANSVPDVVARLEALCALGGLTRDACHAQVAAALRVVVHVSRDRTGRRRVDGVGIFRRRADGWVEVVPAGRFTDEEVMQEAGTGQLREWIT